MDAQKKYEIRLATGVLTICVFMCFFTAKACIQRRLRLQEIRLENAHRCVEICKGNVKRYDKESICECK